ncbi:hypothetical protein FACS1894129_5850 [Actinomycetota bacterium]|nr:MULTISPECIES: alpha/beta hydrolase family protein [Lawsonella]GHT86164.1 hypothetical protein FACS1894129_5850 [Actinomycetota bacterium]
MTVNKRNKWITSLGASLLAISLVAGMGVNLPNANASNRSSLRRDNSSNRHCEWDPAHYWVQQCEVWSDSMHRKIRVQVQPSKNGGKHALFLLDGMRAREDWNGWSHDGHAPSVFVDSDITLVMPVGGETSFYSDWKRKSSTNNQKYTYKWETFLTKELPGYLNRRFGVAYTGNGVGGLSMSGSAAYTLALYHRPYFTQALSFSGYMNVSDPVMQRLLQYAAKDAGNYNLEDMWGPYSDPAWVRNDPYVNAEKLRGLHLFMSSSTGIPGRYDDPKTKQEAINTTVGFMLEGLARQQHIKMKKRLEELGIPCRHVFMANGIHNWGYWHDQLVTAYPYVKAVLG